MVRGDGIIPALRERKAFLDLGTIVENLLSRPPGRSVRFVDLLRAEAYGNMFTGASLLTW